MSVAVRRDRIKLRKRQAEAATNALNEITGVVAATEYQGSYVKVTLDVGGGVFVVNVSDSDYFADRVEAGDRVTASWNTVDVHTLAKAETGATGETDLDATQ